MRADGKVELEQQLVGCGAFVVVRASVLPANLAELARPVGQEKRAAAIGLRRVERPARLIVSGTQIPPPRELVLAEPVVAESLLLERRRQVLAGPHQLRARLEPLVDGPSQRPV